MARTPTARGGWFRALAADWPAIVDALPRPLSTEAARTDLRWLADAGAEMGRRALARRWGWTERQARALLSTAWDADAIGDAVADPDPGTAYASHLCPATASANADNDAHFVPLASHFDADGLPAVDENGRFDVVW